MNQSVRDALRIVYKLVTSFVIVAPIVVFALPAEVAALPLAGSVILAVGAVSKIINELEKIGFLPAWLTASGESGAADAVDSNVVG